MFVTPAVLAVSFLSPRRWEIKSKFFRNWIAVPMALAIVVSVAWTNWPLRASFRLARPRMNQMAARLEKGQSVSTPVRVGLLRIRRAGVGSTPNRKGVVCLCTVEPGGDFEGFARTSPDKARSQFNLWTVIKLDDDWVFISED
jgi:hypothetical protein